MNTDEHRGAVAGERPIPTQVGGAAFSAGVEDGTLLVILDPFMAAPSKVFRTHSDLRLAPFRFPRRKLEFQSALDKLPFTISLRKTQNEKTKTHSIPHAMKTILHLAVVLLPFQPLQAEPVLADVAIAVSDTFSQKAEVESYLRRELRELKDVHLVKEPNPEESSYTLSLIINEPELTSGVKIGYTISVVVISNRGTRLLRKMFSGSSRCRVGEFSAF